MLVAFEGIDGSGKSTVIRRVAAQLRRDGHEVRVTREPTPTWLGRSVRRAISDGTDPLALAFLFLADRARHVADLAAGLPSPIVLSDRYRDSTTAYQAVALDGRVPHPLDRFRDLQDALFPPPDVGVLLDVPAEVGVARIAGRSRKEPFEKIAFLRRVRSNYLRLARGGRLWVVDATPAPAEVAAKALGLVRRHLVA